MPEYMLLLYGDPSHWETLSPEEMQHAIEKYMAWTKKPFYTGGKRLADDLGRVIAFKDGQSRVADGPYSETKEVLGGYYLIEASNYDEAVARTLDHPGLEVRHQDRRAPNIQHVMDPAAASAKVGGLLEHLFRHQSGRIVSRLVRLLGPANLDLAEETVQDAMLRALQTWPQSGVPENAAAWLFRVAHNAAIDAVRRRQLLGDKTEAIVGELSRSTMMIPEDGLDLDSHLHDDELRMIFMCCHPDISREARVALSLKTVSGFSVREIARAFLADEAAIAQRLVRAKRQIRDRHLTFEMPHGDELSRRLDSVLDVIYLMFNEGYASHEGESLIRQDLCFEALRLARLVAASSIAAPRVHALVALIAFQAARLPARVDESGDLVLLAEQDRTRWDQQLIALGFHHFDHSIAGDAVSEYHVQAAIAATHARAPDAESIDWPLILTMYDQLLAINGSPVVALNRAVAVAKVQGPAAALAAIESLDQAPKLRAYYLFLAVRGHLLLALGRVAEAAECFGAALDRPCSVPERRFLSHKLAECAPQPAASS